MKTKRKTMRALVFAAVMVMVMGMAFALPGCGTTATSSSGGVTATSSSGGVTATSSSGGVTATPTSTTVYYTGLRNTRYCEFNLIAPPSGGVAVNTVYNTTHLDTCPTEKWNAENPTNLAKQFDVASVYLNGPRWWTLDEVVVNHVGATLSFGGIEAADWGSINLNTSQPFPSPPFTAMTITRDTQWFYSAGTLVYTLIAPGGKTYYMQSYTTQVNKSLTIDGLLSLGSQLKLPQGWQYKIRILDSNTSVFTVNGTATIVQDNLSNTYQLCQTPTTC